MKTLKAIKHVYRLNAAREELKRATADLALRQNTATSDSLAVKRAADAITAVNARFATGSATRAELANARTVLVDAMNVCHLSSTALDQAISRCYAARISLERISGEALEAVA